MAVIYTEDFFHTMMIEAVLKRIGTLFCESDMVKILMAGSFLQGLDDFNMNKT